MCGGPIEVLSILNSVISAVSGVQSILGGKQKGPSISPQAPPIPTGPATQPDKEAFTRPSPMNAPAALGFGGESLSPLQLRTAIATGGVASEAGRYRTPEAKDYYKNLALTGFTEEGGKPVGEPTGVERQYLQQVFGVTPRVGTTASFLSALERG